MVMLAREPAVRFNIVERDLILGGVGVSENMPKIFHALSTESLRRSRSFDGNAKSMAVKGKVGTGVGGGIDNTVVVWRFKVKDLPENAEMVSVKALKSGSGESDGFTRVKHDCLNYLHVNSVAPFGGEGFLAEERSKEFGGGDGLAQAFTGVRRRVCLLSE